MKGILIFIFGEIIEDVKFECLYCLQAVEIIMCGVLVELY